MNPYTPSINLNKQTNTTLAYLLKSRQECMENLKIVVLESPYDTWNDPITGNLLKDLIGFKLRGYGRLYPYGIMPVDGTDLISTHLLTCRLRADGSLCPIMGVRFTSLKKCRLHYTNFPGMSLVQQANSPEHIEALEKIISEVDTRNADLFYEGSFTIDPMERETKERSIFFRELLTLMYVSYQKETNYSELMGGGTIRFKMEKWLASLGHTPFTKNNIELGPIKVKHLAGEQVLVMHLKEFSFEALRITKKWQHLWDDRLVIKPSAGVDLKRAG